MRTFLFAVSLFTVLILPDSTFAQCHHTGGHAHVSSHAHFTSHTHYHSSHYHSSHCRSHNTYGSNRGSNRYYYGISDPLKGTHELAAGAGAVSAWQIADPTFPAGTPNYFASYRYFFTKGTAVGISAATQTIWGKDSCHCLTKSNPAEPAYLYDYRVTTMTMAADLNWLLYSKKQVQVYQGLSAGLSQYFENDVYPDNTTSSVSGVKFNGQVTLAGLRYGKALGGFVEVGFGYKGLVSGGLSYQTGYKRTHRYG